MGALSFTGRPVTSMVGLVAVRSSSPHTMQRLITSLGVAMTSLL
jgi:hypothetical protein